MSCGCASCEDNLIIDPVVLNEGADGSDGLFGGYSGDWKFESATTTPPSVNFIRFNNASLAASTFLYVNQTNASNIDYSTFLAEFTVDSYIRVFKEFNSSIFWLGKITSVVDSGAYYTIGITTVLTNGALLNNDRIGLSYIPSTISTSLSQVEILYNDVNTSANSTTVSAGFDNIFNYPVAADTLATNGDILKIRLVFRLVSSYASGVAYFKVKFNGADFSTVLTQHEISFSNAISFVDIDFCRESNVQASIDFRCETRDQYYNIHPQTATLELMNGYVFDTNSFDIDIEGKVFAGDTLFLDKVQIIKYTI